MDRRSKESMLDVEEFTEDGYTYVKYPKTSHLPWSKSITKSDKVMSDTSAFDNKQVVVTIKMDGENTTLCRDRIYARSIDSADHPSRHWVKGLWAGLRNDIPPGWRVCGENLFAKHSIAYRALTSYFLGFSIWNGTYCLPWCDTLEWFHLLGISPVEAIYRGIFDKDVISQLPQQLNEMEAEGYVVRLAGGFQYEDFNVSVGKYVRPGHVQTSEHWLYDHPIERNGLAVDTKDRVGIFAIDFYIGSKEMSRVYALAPVYGFDNVRVIKPHTSQTDDHLVNRLNVFVDEDGIIVGFARG